MTADAAPDPDRVRDALGWANRWIGRGRRRNQERLVEFLGVAIAQEPDAVLRIAARIGKRHYHPPIDTTGT